MKRLAILGHPLHPPLVHLPMGLLPLSFALHLWAAVTQNEAIARVARDGLGFGLLAALLALATGFLDFLSITAGHRAERAAQTHLLVMTSAVGCYFVAWLVMRSPVLWATPWLELGCSGLGTLGLLTGGWLGGQLVYRHGVGSLDSPT